MGQNQAAYDDIGQYDFDLPRELIAQHPVEHRIDSRLLLVDRTAGTLEHHYVRDLPDLLKPTDGLVLNDSKVIPARLIGARTSTGGRWEGLFLREDASGVWEILSKTRGVLRVGETISLQNREGQMVEALTILARLDDGHLAVRPVEELPGPDGSPLTTPEEILGYYGRIPLPPYIRDGQMVDDDIKNYQTVYAKHPGSVAAPTAGLHFTTDLVRHLQKKGVQTAAVTLHVGLGTFRPVAAQSLSEHKMHTEWCDISQKSATRLEQVRASGGRVISVGTTSTRVLESAAAANSKPYSAWSGNTDIFIRPGYEFQAIDGLMTNFHLPKSTLLALVAAFAGHELTMRAYQEAVDQRYRFYSYGDCMLIV